jgi:uncharacterized protein (UPF0276 family)
MVRSVIGSVGTVDAPANPAACVGIGLRTPHYQAILNTLPEVGWLEVHSENYFCGGGQPLAMLTRFRDLYPISLHGVGLSLGSIDPLSREHLRKLKALIERIDPILVSEHMSWCHAGGRHLNDLLPLPYTEEALEHMITRVSEAQDFLGRRILLENLSSYLQFADSTIPEWEFIAEVSRRAGCGILLDVNNIYVNSVNHRFDPAEYLAAMPMDAVGEIHLAGFDSNGECLIDTHGKAVADAVWALYNAAIQRLGAHPTLIEWDTDIPELGVLLEEAAKAKACIGALHAKAA